VKPVRHRWWAYGRVLAVPVLLWGLVLGFLWEPIHEWLSPGETQDRTILREWIEESRDDLQRNLRVLIEQYLVQLDRHKQQGAGRDPADDPTLIIRRERIREFLDVMATPPTREHNSTLPLFPSFQSIQVCFDRVVIDQAGRKKHEQVAPPITWSAQVPSEPPAPSDGKGPAKEADDKQADDHDEFKYALLDGRATVKVRYQFHAYDRRQRELIERATRGRQLTVLAVLATGLAGTWLVFMQRREREREQQRQLAQVQVDQAERLLLQEELRRQEAEHRQQEAEHDLLQQKLAAQQYEQKMLELKSQLYASIGIMAGSYAHNIKNLLVRPNDLLRRCLEADGSSPEQTHMLQEVQHTLGTVTERLQQILQTVRRDPSRSEMGRLDLREILRNLEQTWKDLARERWKMQLTVELPAEPLWVEGDVSHLQQAVENLLFNARDATFEMRSHLREQARQGTPNESAKKQALIAAASWKGQVSVRAWQEADEVRLEIGDNGVGMSEEVRRRCTETHFSTKRDNALFEGHSTGMGLGLSFVQVVLDNHEAKLEIDSAPLEGATFRVRFPSKAEAPLAV
jgi:signal transduction histidine kinase